MHQTDYRETLGRLSVTTDGDSWRSHIRSALARNLPEFQPALFPHDGNMVMVASGPSLPQFVEEIRQERENGRPICAVKGAHDFLCEHGIEPDLFVSVEPNFKPVKPNARTVYFLSSRCSPQLFDLLDGSKVQVFHTYSENEKMEELAGRIVVGGGTTSGLRAITLAYLMGFKNFTLYGYDSCNGPDGKTKRFSGEQSGMVVDRIVGGRTFYCNGAMAMQADEFQMYYKVLQGLSLDIKGDGLLAAIVKERRLRGLNS